MALRSPVKDIGLFLARFAVAAPLCLAAWWSILPAYGRVLGWLATPPVVVFLGLPVQAVGIERQGILGTDSLLHFRGDGIDKGILVGQLVTSMAAFTALVLSSTRLAWRRRLRALLLGCLILCGLHVCYILLAFMAEDLVLRTPQIPMAVGQLIITTPFALWIVLVHWERLCRLVGREAEAPGEKEEP